MSPTSAQPGPSRLRIFVLLAGVALVAHFFLFSGFGLYEDDYFYTLPNFHMSFGGWWAGAVAAVVHPVQGRPLNHLVRRTLFALTLQGNSLHLAYLVSLALITTNAFLIWRLLAARLSRPAGAAGALLYLLHPADTARQILMHQTDIHFGAMLALGALVCFHRRRWLLGWLLGVCCLLNYESFFLPLLLAPFLVGDTPPSVRKTGFHTAAWFAVFGGVAAGRWLLGETRAGDVAEHPLALLPKIARAVVIGPATSLRLLIERPIDALLHPAPLIAGAAAVVFALSICLLAAGRADRPEETADRGAAWVAAGGAAGLMVSYLFAFRPDSYPPITGIGRLSALHEPGIICTAFILAAGVHLAWRRLGGAGRAGLVAALSVWFGAMAAFGAEIQLTEYVADWSKQCAYWRAIVAQAPDAADGDIILVDVEGSTDVIPVTPGFARFGMVNYPPLALARFADLPGGWRNPPRVFGLWNDAPLVLANGGWLLETPPYFRPDEQPMLRNHGFIFLRAEGGRLTRVSGPVYIRGHRFLPKPPPAVAPAAPLRLSPLFRALASPLSRPPPPSDWPTIRNERNYPS